MHCIHIASELAPVAKVGGLADVLLGLCRELSWKGLDVDIIVPKYDCMDTESIRDFTIESAELMSFFDGEWFQNIVWIGWVENLKVYFIEPHHPRYFFNRGCYYGCNDDMDRYLYFSRAALEFIKKKELKPDVIHIHDWQTAVIAPLFSDVFLKQGLHSSKLVCTIHNMEYQGKCLPSDLDKIGLTGSDYLVPEKLQDNLYANQINLLKGGIVYSDYVTTVSPNYAKEVLTPLGGRGLDITLLKYQNKFQGVLNGLDYSYWNPEIDRYLPAHYSPREMPKDKKDHITLDRKFFIKKCLRERLMLADCHKPIIGCVVRLVPQKGIELIKHALNYALENNAQFVLLGSSPILSISDDFHHLKQIYAEHNDISLTLHHQEELAHLIFAGSDMFIVPSLFEPCGLTQIIALKYGTIPVVRNTGGLADSVFDIDYSGQPEEKTNGFVFDHPDNQGLESALGRAIHYWFDQPDRWRKLIIRSMKMDFSWNIPAGKYLEIYNKIVGD